MKTLHIVDWILLTAYILVVLYPAVCSIFRKKEQDAKEFLVAGHSVSWFVVAVSVFATLFSTISFVSSPGEAFNYGIVYFVVGQAQILVMPLAIYLFLRFFFRASAFTAYEYLEQRFDRKCRVTGALIFLLIRLFYTGCVFYSAAVIFEAMLGWHPNTTILVIGVLTIFYAWAGGARAIITADVIQAVVIVLGICAIAIGVLHAIHFDLKGVFAFAHQHNHLLEDICCKEFFQINVKERYNFYLLMMCIIFNPLQSMSCDQMVIQRLLSGKNFEQAKRSVYTNCLLGIPVTILLYLIGLCLFYYYKSGIGTMPPGMKGDQALATFVLNQLPTPFPGLIAIALLAAMMSTIAGAVNSLTAVLFKDIIPPRLQQRLTEKQELVWCKRLTVLFGAVTVGMALMLFAMGDGLKTTVMEVVSVCSALWPVLFSGFLYGVLSKRVSAKAMFVSFVIGIIVGIVCPYVFYYGVSEEMRWSFQWVTLPGQLVSFLCPPLLSLIWPNKKNINGLTITTLSSTGNAK